MGMFDLSLVIRSMRSEDFSIVLTGRRPQMKRRRFTEKQIISILQERAGECSAAIGQRPTL